MNRPRLQIWALIIGCGGDGKVGQWKRVGFSVDVGSCPGRHVHLGSVISVKFIFLNHDMGMLMLSLEYFCEENTGRAKVGLQF